MEPCCARPNVPLRPRHGRRERISPMRKAGRALCPPPDSLAFVAMSGRAPRSRRRGSTQRLLVQAPPPVDMPCGEQRDCASCRSASAYRPSRCGEGRVPRVPSPAVAACGGTVKRVPPRARPVYIHGRAQSARTPPGCKGTATRPRAPSEPHMCAECEDNAEREIVLDTARGGAYYSILRQARKRLSESRGAEPRRREP